MGFETNSTDIVFKGRRLQKANMYMLNVAQKWDIENLQR